MRPIPGENDPAHPMNDPLPAPAARELSDFIENRTYDEIQVGDKSVLTRTLRPEDIQLFAIMSGDVNPAHVDPGNSVPSTVEISQTLKFSRPVKVGDTITITLTCTQKFG